jgi:hypothetical protein
MREREREGEGESNYQFNLSGFRVEEGKKIMPSIQK